MMKNNDINLLRFYTISGVNESYGNTPHDFLQKSIQPSIKDSFDNTFKQTNQTILSINEISKIAEQIANSITSIAELETAIKNFEHSPLKKKSNQTIIGTGCLAPKLLVITEIPNIEEDKTGIPFTGPTGDLLKKMLSAISHDIQTDTFTMPIVPYRPAGGRPPTIEETSTTLPFIKKYIELLRPSIILLMGTSPASAILKTTEPITSIRGKWFDYMGIPTIATFSLGYIQTASQNGIKDIKQKTWEDLQELNKKL